MDAQESALTSTNAALLREALAVSEDGRLRAEAHNAALRSELAQTQEVLEGLLERRQQKENAAAVPSTFEGQMETGGARKAAEHQSKLLLVMRARLAGLAAPLPASRPANFSGEDADTHDHEVRRRARALGIHCKALFLRRNGSMPASTRS